MSSGKKSNVVDEWNPSNRHQVGIKEGIKKAFNRLFSTRGGDDNANVKFNLQSATGQVVQRNYRIVEKAWLEDSHEYNVMTGLGFVLYTARSVSYARHRRLKPGQKQQIPPLLTASIQYYVYCSNAAINMENNAPVAGYYIKGRSPQHGGSLPVKLMQGTQYIRLEVHGGRVTVVPVPLPSGPLRWVRSVFAPPLQLLPPAPLLPSNTPESAKNVLTGDLAADDSNGSIGIDTNECLNETPNDNLEMIVQAKEEEANGDCDVNEFEIIENAGSINNSFDKMVQFMNDKGWEQAWRERKPPIKIAKVEEIRRQQKWREVMQRRLNGDLFASLSSSDDEGGYDANDKVYNW